MDTTAVEHCPYCGNIHDGVCPKVKAIEYHPNGTVKRVEFHDWKTDWTWPEMPWDSTTVKWNPAEWWVE